MTGKLKAPRKCVYQSFCFMDNKMKVCSRMFWRMNTGALGVFNNTTIGQVIYTLLKKANEC
jgi:hypothetical protein